MKNLALIVLVFFLITVAGVAFAEIPNPDTYVMLTIAEPDTLDPHQAYDVASGEVIQFVYDNLIAYDGQSLTDFVPWLAMEVPSLENELIMNEATTYIFPLREGVKFHNGNELTPEDVVYSFHRGILADPAAGPMWMLIEAIFGYYSLEDFVFDKTGISLNEALDPESQLINEEYRQPLIDFYQDYIQPAIQADGWDIVFHLSRPFGPFMSILARNSSWAVILDKDTSVEMGCWDGEADGWWEHYNLRKEDSPLYDQAVGTGPFRLIEWDRVQQRVTLERNDDFWGEKPWISTAILWEIEEWGTRRAMLEAGDADQIHTPQQYYEQVTDMPGISVELGDFVLVDSMQFLWEVGPGSPYLGSGQLDGNGIPPDFFSDIHVRRAFNYALDYDTLVEHALGNLVTRIPSVLPVGFLGWSEDQPRYEFDMEKAAEEFQMAWDGELWENGFTVSLFYNIGNERRQTTCEMLQENIESINPKFRVEVIGLQWPTFLDAYRNEHMPAFIIGWQADYADPHNFISTYLHSAGTFSAHWGEPFREFARENLDHLVEQAVMETDPSIRESLYREVQDIAYETAAFGLPLFQPRYIFTMRDWVQGWTFHSMRPGEVNLDQVWKEEN